MVESLRLVSFAAVMFGIALVPGPAAAYCLAAGLETRRGLSFTAAAGVALGKLVHLAVAVVGAFWVAHLHPGIRTAMLAAVAAFMILQGVRRWLHPGSAVSDGDISPTSSRLAQGFAISVVNPQSLASSLAVVPLFISDATSTIGALSMLGAAGLAVFAAYVVYEGIAVVAVRHLTARSQTRMVGATYFVAATGLGLAALV